MERAHDDVTGPGASEWPVHEPGLPRSFDRQDALRGRVHLAESEAFMGSMLEGWPALRQRASQLNLPVPYLGHPVGG